MLSTVLRSRALARTRSIHALTRFTLPAPAAVQPSLSSAARTFASSPLSRNDEYDERRDSSRGMADFYAERRPRPRNNPSETLYIGNLPFTTVKDNMYSLLSDFGTIKAIRMATHPSGESKGFAHVEFDDVASAQKAVDAYDETQFSLDGRTLYLDFAATLGKVKQPPHTSLYMTNLGGDADEATLEDALAEFKDVIRSIRIVPNVNSSNRFGFIDCLTVEDATAILNKFNGKEIAQGQTLQLSYARPRSEVQRFTSYRENYGFGERGTSSSYDAEEGEYRPRQGYSGNRGGFNRGRGRGSYGMRGNGSNRGREEGSFRGREEGSYRGREEGSYRGGGRNERPYGGRQRSGESGENDDY